MSRSNVARMYFNMQAALQAALKEVLQQAGVQVR
jgi:hypothetical protein